MERDDSTDQMSADAEESNNGDKEQLETGAVD